MAQPAHPATRTGGTATVVLATAAGVWIVGAAVLPQSLAWLLAELIVAAGATVPIALWPATAALSLALISVPALLLSRLARSVPVRWTGRAWLAAGLSLGALGSLRAVRVPHSELYLALFTVVAGGLATLIALVNRRARTEPAQRLDSPAAPRLLAAAAGLACLVPWLWLGALGGILETVLAVAAALALGWLAATILHDRFWAAFAGEDRAYLVVLGGLVAGAALAPLSAAAGAGAVPLLALVAVPALGWTVAALQATTFGRDPWTTRILLALAFFGPLAFVDADEMGLLLNLGSRDVLFWVTVAAGAALATALLAATGYGIALVHRGRPVRARVPKRSVAAGLVVATGLVATVSYALPGQPGLYGERLFVVMREQADLTGLSQLSNRQERLQATYRRLVEHAGRTQAALRTDLDRLRLAYTPYYLVNGIEVGGGPAVRAWLSRRNDVDRVLLSPRLRPLPGKREPQRGTAPAPATPQWNITQLGADRVWQDLGVTGRGIVIGTSDSGVDGTHPALSNGFRGGDDSWYDPWNGTRVPSDHNGHGTHALGSAVGRDSTGAVPSRSPAAGVPSRVVPAVGVAPGAEWMGCVNLDRNLANPAYYLDCLQFMLAPFRHGGDPLRDGRPERAAHILTNSWACPPEEGCDRAALRPAMAALAAAGIFVVAAAGNTGPTCGSVDTPPAPYPDVVAVAAVDREGNAAFFSSRGPTSDGLRKPDVAAPGVAVLSTLPGGTYGELDGTSMATPHVAGVVALMWSANPELIGDIERTRQILSSTARPALPTFGEGGDDACGGAANVYGAGVVDAEAAVRAAR